MGDVKEGDGRQWGPQRGMLSGAGDRRGPHRPRAP